MLEADWYNTEMQYLCETSFILIKSAHLLSTYCKVHASPNRANLSIFLSRKKWLLLIRETSEHTKYKSHFSCPCRSSGTD